MSKCLSGLVLVTDDIKLADYIQKTFPHLATGKISVYPSTSTPISEMEDVRWVVIDARKVFVSNWLVASTVSDVKPEWFVTLLDEEFRVTVIRPELGGPDIIEKVKIYNFFVGALRELYPQE